MENGMDLTGEKIFNYGIILLPPGKHTYYYKNSGLEPKCFILEGMVFPHPIRFLIPIPFPKTAPLRWRASRFSKDGSMAAYNISEGGSELAKLVLMNATDKKPLADTLRSSSAAPAGKAMMVLLCTTTSARNRGRFCRPNSNRKLGVAKRINWCTEAMPAPFVTWADT